MQASVSSNGRNTLSAAFTVIADNQKPLIGRDFFGQRVLAVTQSPSHTDNQFKIISPQSVFKEHIALKFSNLLSRIGRSKILVAKSRFRKIFQPRQEIGRRMPINLQDENNRELKKLLDEKRVIKLTNCPDKCFTSPIVVTVKTDRLIKFAYGSIKSIKKQSI